jgi:hypothetical protein
MVSVEINEVQFGTAKAMKEKNGSIKYEKFKVLPLRNSVSRFLDVDWKALGDVDMVVNMEKQRVRIYPHGVIKTEAAIIDAKITLPKKRKPGEVDIEWKIGAGHTARSIRSIFFRIPDAPPPYVKGAKPKKTEPESPTKSKKQTNR